MSVSVIALVSSLIALAAGGFLYRRVLEAPATNERANEIALAIREGAIAFLSRQYRTVAVVGVPDPKFVEEVAAWIKLKQDTEVTEAELREFCRAKLAHYKTPRYIQFVTEFPQTVTGKIQKFKIREAIIAEHGLEETETA